MRKLLAPIGVLLLSILLSPVPPAQGGASLLDIRLSAASPSQGDPVLVRATATVPADAATARWEGREYPLKQDADGGFLGVIGVDLLAPPGKRTLAVEARRGRRVVARADIPVTVRGRTFPVQELTLPPRMTEFDRATLQRIDREAKRLAGKFSRISSPVRWTVPFLPPVADFRPGPFGSRRVINGEPRSPHAGVDLVLPEGTPVVAIADGVVAFAGEQFFGGNSVVLDHGGGLFSVYYHLREAVVSDGQEVARGERIGSVGMSGRATGPHLHFSVRAAGGRVDPTLLLALPAR
ncbi:MAG: M23 family metallopeptidase [Deltaproteobacteria bacterium]